MRFAFDLGTNSLGWCVFSLKSDGKPERIVAMGSRIFGAAAGGAGRDSYGVSLGKARRDARAMRRRRDRFKQRQAALLKHLTRLGLFPADEAARKALEGLDPYELRARALTDTLTLSEIGRALFHLNQRRGFKSNRKAERGKDEDAGKIALGVEALRDAMDEAGAETLGAFLHGRRASAPNGNEIPSVRTRLKAGSANAYEFYPSRAILEHEFETIWERQAPHYPDVLTEEEHDCLYEIVFHQRPLKTPKIGRCTLVSDEERLPKAHPLFQRRRLLEEVNALQIVRPGEKAERLTREQRDTLLLKLQDKREVVFDTLRKALKLDPDSRFNKESENRKKLIGDEIAAAFSEKKRFGKLWLHLTPDEQWEVVDKLRELETDEDEQTFRSWLRETHKLGEEAARAVCGAPTPEGFGRFGLTATTKLIEALKADVIVYSEAVEKAGLRHHSDFRTGEIFQDPKTGLPALPYYGVVLERHILPGTADPKDKDDAQRIGRLTNPTVHIGLNQLREVVKHLIRRFGKPGEIAIELARELKLDEDEKKKRNRENNENRIAAEQRSKKLIENGKQDTGANRALLKLWEELNPENCLDRRCPYSGRQIGIDMLFNDAVDVDHILPFTRTLDDSNANKTVCLRRANRLKGNRTPYEARDDFHKEFGSDAEWEAIGARAAKMPRKSWRFQPDAMQRFDSDDPEFGKGFIARQLTDTQHLSRLAREYLSALYPERGKDSSKVWVSPGRLTEMVRRKLGLNDLLHDHNLGADQPKNRKDHRHHAIDAAVIGIVDRGMLQAAARASGQEGADGREKIVFPEPWEGFREDLRRAVNDIVVSHRPDHGTVSKASLAKGADKTAGRLHNDTAYGLTGQKDAKDNDIVVRRVSLSWFDKPSKINAVRDDHLRQALKDWTAGKEGAAFEQALRTFGDKDLGPRSFPNIRRVRVVEPLKVIPIRDRSGRAYKGYKGDSNYRYDVWELKDGKWVSEVVSMFDAHSSAWSSAIRSANPTAKKVLSLHRDDILAIEREDGIELMRIVKFSEKQFAIAAPNEAGALKARDADKADPFKYAYPSPNTLKAWRARQVRIDPLGRVSDPGFPARTAVRRTKPKA